MDDEDDAGAAPAEGGNASSWHSADFTQQLQLNADEESQFSAFSTGHSATIFVIDASTDMLRTTLSGANLSQSAFRWAVEAVLASVRQLVFSNRNDHVGLVFFGCRQQAQLLPNEEFDDDSDELSMRTAHTIMYLHKAGLDTLRALYKLSKLDEDKIEHQCESLTPGDSSTSSVHIVVGEALWKAHRMLEYANQWFASKRVVILTVSDDPHGIGSGGRGGKAKSNAAETAQKFSIDRAERLHNAGTEIFVVPFKLADDASFDMAILYGDVQKITTKSAQKGALEISPANVDDIENLVQTLAESAIIKRPVCTLPLSLSDAYALPLAIYHPITKFTKLPLLWLKSNQKHQDKNKGAANGNVAHNQAGDEAEDADEVDDEDAGNGTTGNGERMHVMKRKRVFVDPNTSGIVPADEIKKRMVVLGREIIFSAQEAKSWKEFGTPSGIEILASCPLWLAHRFLLKNYIKPTLFMAVKLTSDVHEQKATLKVFRALLEACQSQSRALVIRYTPPARLGTTRIALLIPDASSDAEKPPSSASDQTKTQRTKRGAATASKKNLPTLAGFQMVLVPYIQELRDVVDKLYERSTTDNIVGSTQHHLVDNYASLIDALTDEWTPKKYYNPAVYQYYLKLEAQVCKWPRSEIPKELDDPTIPDYDAFDERAGTVLAKLTGGHAEKSRGAPKKKTAAAATTTSRGSRKTTRAAASQQQKEEEMEDEQVEQDADIAKPTRGGRKKQQPAATARAARRTSPRSAAAKREEVGEEVEVIEEKGTQSPGGERRRGRGAAKTDEPAKVIEDLVHDDDNLSQPVAKRGRSKSPARRSPGRSSVAKSQQQLASTSAAAMTSSVASSTRSAEAANTGMIKQVESHARNGTLHLVGLEQLVSYCVLRGLDIDASVRETLTNLISDHVRSQD